MDDIPNTWHPATHGGDRDAWLEPWPLWVFRESIDETNLALSPLLLIPSLPVSHCFKYILKQLFRGRSMIRHSGRVLTHCFTL